MEPEYFSGPINIPMVVSLGYLVFCPDIHYRAGRAGESIYNYVISAAEAMSKEIYINSKKMGIQGHSMGGYEVNYLITHSNIFAAAVSAAGQSNLISSSGTPRATEVDPHVYIAMAQQRLGTTFWKDRSLYINNSQSFSQTRIGRHYY